MTPKTFEEALGIVLAEMRGVLLDRHRKYGPKNITATGIMGLFVRCEDKLARIENTLKDKTLSDITNIDADYADESFDDAWLDMANYSGPIYLMLRRGWWTLPLISEVHHEGSASLDVAVSSLFNSLPATKAVAHRVDFGGIEFEPDRKSLNYLVGR